MRYPFAEKPELTLVAIPTAHLQAKFLRLKLASKNSTT
jgi:hypothetical protein